MGNISVKEMLDHTGNASSKKLLKKVESIFAKFDDAIFYPKRSMLSPDVEEANGEFEENYFILSRKKIVSLQRGLKSNVTTVIVYKTKDVKTFYILQDQSKSRTILTIDFYHDESIILDSKLDSNEVWNERFQNRITEIFDNLIQIE